MFFESENTYEYKKGEDVVLALSTQKKYVRRLLWAARDKFGHLEEHTQFLFCLTKDVKS